MTTRDVLRWVVIGGVFLLPFVCLIVATSLFFPYITGKNFFFRVVVEVMGCAWLALALIDPKYRPRRSWILGAFGVFIVLIAIADAHGVNPLKSFWSNYERMDGWVTIAHIFVYLVVASIVINTEKLWGLLWKLSLMISVFVDLYGFLQIAGGVALGEGGVSGLTARIDATFGNPIYLAAYMLFNVFIAAMLISQEGKGEWTILERLSFSGVLVALSVWLAATAQAPALLVLLFFVCIALVIALLFVRRTYLLSFIIALDTVALLFTGTRGTTLGLIGGAVLAALIYMYLTPESRIARRIAIGSVAFVVVFGGILWFARDTAFVQKVGFLQRLATISLQDDTTRTRIINWSIAWQGVKERPVLGWGQENFAIVFDKYYDPRMYAQEQWFDRVHNIIFDWWIAGGTLGLLAYLSIFAAALWTVWRKGNFTVAEKSILIGLLAGYFCHNFFVFDNITSYILFGTVLAYIAWRAGEADDSPRLWFPSVPRGAAPAATLVALAAAGGMVWWVNASAFEANLTILSGLAQQPGGLSQNLANFEHAISYNTYGNQEAREQLTQVATQIANASGVSDTLKEQFATTAAQELELQAQVSPLDARFPLFEGVLLDAYGAYDQAASALQRALTLSPTKQSIMFELGLNAEARGDTAGALRIFANAYNEETDDTDARIFYAAAAIRAGEDSLADQLLAPIIATGQAADPRIESAYVSRKEYGKLVTIWKAAVAVDPTNVQDYFTLAAAYYTEGDSPDAIAELQAAEQKNPSSSAQVDSLIQQIKSGTVKLQ